MERGRPTTYKPEYCQMLIDYFKDSSRFKTKAGFALSIGTHRDTIHAWSKTHPDFSDALKIAESHQEDWLVKNGMDGTANTAFAIFTAKNVLKWRDKQPEEVASFNMNKMNDEEKNQLLQELKALLSK